MLEVVRGCGHRIDIHCQLTDIRQRSIAFYGPIIVWNSVLCVTVGLVCHWTDSNGSSWKIIILKVGLMNATLGVSAIHKPYTKCDHLVSSVASLDIRIVRPSYVFPFHVKLFRLAVSRRFLCLSLCLWSTINQILAALAKTRILVLGLRKRSACWRRRFFTVFITLFWN